MSKIEKVFTRCDGCRTEVELTDEKRHSFRIKPTSEQWVRVYVGESTTCVDYCPTCWEIMRTATRGKCREHVAAFLATLPDKSASPVTVSSWPCLVCSGMGSTVRASGTTESMVVPCGPCEGTGRMR